MSISRHIVVVGGGVIGLSAAFRLARRGCPVTVLERHECGSGASGLPMAALWPSAATKRGLGHVMHRASLWRLENFVREVESVARSSIDFRRVGRIEIFATSQRRAAAEREAAAACEEWPSFGEGPVQRILSQEEVTGLEPALAPAPLGGLLCRATACVSGRQLIAALREACIRSGVSVLENTEVLDLWLSDNRVRGVLTPTGPIAADVVLVSAGAPADDVAPEIAHVARIAPVKGQVIVLSTAFGEEAGRMQENDLTTPTEIPRDNFPPESPMGSSERENTPRETPTGIELKGPRVPLGSSGSDRRCLIQHLVKKRRTYLIPCANGDISVGATNEPEAGFELSITSEGRSYLRKCASDLVPHLSSADVVEQWVGLRPQTLDGRPFMGPVKGIEGLYVAGGHYKVGVAMAPLGADLMTSLILGEEPEFPLEAFRTGRG